MNGQTLSLRRRVYNRGMRALVWLCAGLTCALLVFLIGYIFCRGIPGLTWELLSGQTSYIKNTIGILPNILNTLYIILVAMVIVLPLGVGAAIYLTEYAENRRLVSLIEFAAETLTGIPSIIFGLFGLLFFSTALHWGYSLLAGAMTLVIMILPLIIRTTEEALMGVPDAYREASFGLGAGKLRTVFKVVLPSAIPGILSGVVLATGRIVGETAALIYTAGSVAKVPSSLMGSGRTLAVHMYVLASEGLYMKQAYATAVILVVIVVAINALSSRLAKQLMKGK